MIGVNLRQLFIVFHALQIAAALIVFKQYVYNQNFLSMQMDQIVFTLSQFFSTLISTKQLPGQTLCSVKVNFNSRRLPTT